MRDFVERQKLRQFIELALFQSRFFLRLARQIRQRGQIN